MYDIAIIGAGPAGATLARLLGMQYKILLIEKKVLSLPDGQQATAKCCGGLLAPDAQRMLATMGLGLPRDVLAGPQLFAVRAIDVPNRIERYYQRPYLNMDRGKFDQWLTTLVPSGVDIRQSCFFRSFEINDAGVTIHLAESGAMRTERARIVIGADGAFSLLRKQAFPLHPAPKAYVAIQEWCTSTELLPHFIALFDPEITDFYSWIIPKNGRLLIGSALRPGDQASAQFGLFKTKLRDLGFAFEESGERSGALLLRPRRASQVLTGDGRIALIGEAAGWISPSSAEGISYAFRSAVALADALGQGVDGFQKRYRRNTRALRRNIRRKNCKARVMYRPLLRKLVMQSGLRSIDVRLPEQP